MSHLVERKQRKKEKIGKMYVCKYMKLIFKYDFESLIFEISILRRSLDAKR